ncbi:MAG: DEAD/DEAH box helicase, partial [bacterium]|nr:DEAD/DEAH box helicase [bacterium]
MPAVARALNRDADGPPQAPAIEALGQFTTLVLDSIVRKSATPPSGKATVHDCWLASLHSRDAALDGDPAELAAFAQQVQEWQRPLSVAARSPFRLSFRLDEPKKDDAPWTVNYLLQAADDPSLLIPAAAAMRPKRREKAVLDRYNFDAREYLLQALGQASTLCPKIESSLKAAAPAGYKTGTTGAHEFLTQRALSLEQAGFGVMLPAWWTRKGTKVRLKAKADVTSPKMQAGAGLTLESIVEFNYQLALGGHTLSYKELEELARLKTPLVKLRGQWVELNAEEIRQALEFWKEQGSGKTTLGEVVKMALGATETPAGIEVEGVSADGWIGELLGQLEGRSPTHQLTQPRGFEGALRPYQERGFSWLNFLRTIGLGPCLADDMGLGKTIQTLALIQHDWNGAHQRPVLLICPTSVVGNWQKEAERFTPELPVTVHHGARREKGTSFAEKAASHAIVISSYALLQRDIESFKRVAWAGIVLDEAQNIKNPETKQARAARSLPAGYRIALTGTPVENNVGDLWSIMEFLNPGFLGSQAGFRRSFFIPIQTRSDPTAGQRLQRLTGPFVLRRLKTDRSIIADLPDKLEMKVFCNLTTEQASLYRAVVKDATEELDSAEGIQRKGVVLATLSKLKQVCNHPAQFLGDNSAIRDRSGKLARLGEMLQEVLEVGDRALIFTQFAEMGHILRRHLEETFGREALF